MKNFILLITFLYIGITTFSNTIVVNNPGANNDIQMNIKTAIDGAMVGDIIQLPAGTFSFGNNILVNKAVSIKGAGLNQTILYRSESLPDVALTKLEYFFKFNINSNFPSGIVISDITFKSKRPLVATGDGGSLASDFALKMINVVDFKIINCRFENFGNAAIAVQHDDSIVKGLITKCEFYHNVKGADGLGLGYGIVVYGANSKWIVNPRFGTGNFIFIENNTFDTHRHAIAAAGCGLYVARYNIIINNTMAQAIDAHEGRQVTGSNYYSTRACEIYNNYIINTTFKDGSPIISGQSAQQLANNAIIIRGGESVIHDNYIQGFRFGVGIINFVVTGPQTYPIQSTIGYLSGLQYGYTHIGVEESKGSGDVFSWNNIFTPYSGIYSSGSFYNFQPEYFVQERDYHLTPKPNYSTYAYPRP